MHEYETYNIEAGWLLIFGGWGEEGSDPAHQPNQEGLGVEKRGRRLGLWTGAKSAGTNCKSWWATNRPSRHWLVGSNQWDNSVGLSYLRSVETSASLRFFPSSRYQPIKCDWVTFGIIKSVLFKTAESFLASDIAQQRILRFNYLRQVRIRSLPWRLVPRQVNYLKKNRVNLIRKFSLS